MAGTSNRLFADDTTARRRESRALPRVPREQVHKVAERAQLDAMDLATGVRDLDPHEVWGRLHALVSSDPQRLVAAAVALAAMVDVDAPVSQLLAWLRPLSLVEVVA